MKKGNVLAGIGLFILVTSLIVGTSLYLQGDLTPSGIIIIIGSSLLSAAAFISGVKDSIDITKQISENKEVKAKSSIFSITSPMHNESFQVGSVIKAHGKHAIPQNSFVWAITTDTYGHYYLQNPSIKFESTEIWRSTNIHLGLEIIEIIFVKVTNSGNIDFLKKVRDEDWGAFDYLPLGAVILGRTPIRVG